MRSKGEQTRLLSLALSRLADVFPSASGAQPAVSPVCRPRRDGRHGLFSGAIVVRGFPDSYGIELTHPASRRPVAPSDGRKGLSNRRWNVGGKLCLVVNQWGLIDDWDCHPANVHDTVFQAMIGRLQEEMIRVGRPRLSSPTGPSVESEDRSGARLGPTAWSLRRSFPC